MSVSIEAERGAKRREVAAAASSTAAATIGGERAGDHRRDASDGCSATELPRCAAVRSASDLMHGSDHRRGKRGGGGEAAERAERDDAVEPAPAHDRGRA